ncbi:MAG: NAD(+) kinase [Sulfurovum sp.]|nr:NAD(+) kinase [Sulfurovum sp.]
MKIENIKVEKLNKIEKAGFALRPDSPDIKDTYSFVKKQFNDSGIEVILSNDSAVMIGAEGVDFDSMCQECDFLVSLGGDGTLLSLVRNSYKYHKPVVGINAGNLGFLADVTILEVGQFLELLRQGEYHIDHRMMIAGYILRRSGERVNFFALNDIVVTSPIPSKMVHLNASIHGEKFNTYRGDGIIVSTPTGSTAYNLAAGGPVVYPLTKAFIITPVMAHSLTNQRPLVVPSDFYIELDAQKDEAMVSVDGQERYDLEEGDILHIGGAEQGAKLLHRKERSYFSVLREKLHWGDKL